VIVDPRLAAVLLSTVTSATPLLYAALGEAVVQRSGVVNVGLEGILLTGALTATLVTFATHLPILGVLAAATAGVVLACLFAVFTVGLGANQVVVGVVVNLFALGLTGTLYRKLFSESGEGVHTSSLPLYAGVTVLTPLALVAVILVWWWTYRTRFGLELRACGEQPVAAEAAGTPVRSVRALTLCFGGLMAGIGGAFLSIADSNTFVPNMSAGRGFIALAIVTAGRWNPWGCLAAALIFGLADALQFQGQALGLDALYHTVLVRLNLSSPAHSLNLEHLPYPLFLALPYVVTILILSGSSRGVAAPASLGRPYRKL
jgi:simple sugar transport system permease protein